MAETLQKSSAKQNAIHRAAQLSFQTRQFASDEHVPDARSTHGGSIASLPDAKRRKCPAASEPKLCRTVAAEADTWPEALQTCRRQAPQKSQPRMVGNDAELFSCANNSGKFPNTGPVSTSAGG
jgi:hypothetical protein